MHALKRSRYITHYFSTCGLYQCWWPDKVLEHEATCAQCERCREISQRLRDQHMRTYLFYLRQGISWEAPNWREFRP